MKEVRVHLPESDYLNLRNEADSLGVPLKKLVQDRVVGVSTADTPLCSAKILADEVAELRAVLNQIIRCETAAEVRLFEDDVIRIQVTMEKVELLVAECISRVIREVRSNGDAEV